MAGWPGVAILLLGALLGFFADSICKRFFPDEPKRAAQCRLIGLALSFAGAIWTLYLS